jgi:glutamate-1-semialdehyde 2,1-aminomutase
VQRSGLPMCVTGWGSMMTLHTTAGPVTSPADLAGADPVLKELVFHELLHRGVYVAPRGFVALSLAVTDDDVDTFVTALDETLTSLAAANS